MSPIIVLQSERGRERAGEGEVERGKLIGKRGKERGGGKKKE